MPTSSFDKEFILSELAILRLNKKLQEQEEEICKGCNFKYCYPDGCEILHPELRKIIHEGT